MTLILLILIYASTPLVARDFVLETPRGRIVFDPISNRMVVGWSENRNLEFQVERLAGMKDVSHPPLDRTIPAGAATVLRLTHFLSDEEANELAENLLVSNDVAWIAPALAHEGQSYIPSGMIVLQPVAGGISVEEMEEFELTHLRARDDGTFFARPSRESSLEILDLCNQIAALGSIEWCEPVWLEGDPFNGADELLAPRVTIHCSGDDIQLSWQWCGNVNYEVWSSTNAGEPLLEAVIQDTQYTDSGVLSRQVYKLYHVRAATREP